MPKRMLSTELLFKLCGSKPPLFAEGEFINQKHIIWNDCFHYVSIKEIKSFQAP
jgi:hypothetical protein